MTIALIIIAVLLFLIYKAIQGNSYRYDSRKPSIPPYKSLVAEDRFKIDIVPAFSTMVESSVSTCRRHGVSQSETDIHVHRGINNLKHDFKKEGLDFASRYGLPLNVVLNSIDEIAEGAKAHYTIHGY